jgi:ketosteroid isomerase-like protein
MPRIPDPRAAARWILPLSMAVGFGSLILPAPRLRSESLALQSMVAAERAFSAQSVRSGMKPAFLAWLAEDGVIFRPLPVNGRRSWQERPNPDATLAWTPTWAEVSHAGDLGVDSGPWIYRGKDPNQAPLYGHFISVWKRAPRGPWRVALDLGIVHGPPDADSVGTGRLAEGPSHEKIPSGSALDLRKLDVAFSEATIKDGVGSAFADRAAPDVRLNREGSLPFVGLESARAQMDSLPGTLTFLTQGSRLSISRDLGYSYGIAQHFPTGDRKDPALADSSVYLHVWRQNPDRTWHLALVVMNPLPKTGRK